MSRVWKYTLPLETNPITFQMPEGAKIIHCAMQRGEITMWAIVSPDRPLESRTFGVIGTGQDVHDDLAHVGSVQADPFVWHIFEDTAPDR